MTDDLIFRLADPAALGAAALSGVYEGTAHDQTDGFIHCSARHQIEGTLAAHFGDVHRIALAVIDAGKLGASLKWEKSRGGEDFPHIYGPLPFTAILRVHLLRRDESGGWRLPEEL